MSEYAELAAHLRGVTPCGCNGCWNSMQLAADAIEGLESKVARLRAVHVAAKALEAGIRDQAFGCWCIPGEYRCVTHLGFDLAAALDAVEDGDE